MRSSRWDTITFVVSFLRTTLLSNLVGEEYIFATEAWSESEMKHATWHSTPIAFNNWLKGMPPQSRIRKTQA